MLNIEFKVIAAYWISTSVLPLIEILQLFALLDQLLVTLPPSKRFEPFNNDKMISFWLFFQLIVAGMEIARLNFSHGTHDYHKETIENIKVARAELQNENPFKFKPIAIALDTKGPEIRTGLIKGSGSATISLNQVINIPLMTNNWWQNFKGDKFRLSLDSNDLENGNQFKIYVDYGNLSQVVKPGDSIYMDDGLISLKVLETNE